MSPTLNISLEGNIGSGKSTVLELIRQNLNCTVIPEPIDKWVNLHGLNLLEYSYTSPKEHFFTFQMYVYLTQLEQYHSMRGNIRIFERSPFSSHKVFVKSRINSLNIQQTKVCQEWYNFLTSPSTAAFNIDIIIYIRTSPSVALERLKKRDRIEEKSLSQEIITELHDLHEQWLLNENKTPLIIINGDKNLDEIKLEIKEVITKIRDLHLETAEPPAAHVPQESQEGHKDEAQAGPHDGQVGSMLPL